MSDEENTATNHEDVEPTENQQDAGALDQNAEDTNTEESATSEEPVKAGKEDVADGSGDDNSDSDGGSSGEEFPDKAKARIKKITTQKWDEKLAKDAASKRADAAEKRALEAEKEVEKLKGESSEKELKEPVSTDFETDEEYYKALSVFNSKRAVKAALAEQDTQRQKDTAIKTEREAVSNHDAAVLKHIDAGREAFTDFDDVTQSLNGKITDKMADALLDDEDYGHKVAYYLANNLDKLSDLVSKTPSQAIMGLGVIADTISRNTKKISKTTSPATRLLGKKGLTTRSAYADDSSMEEYVKARKAASG